MNKFRGRGIKTFSIGFNEKEYDETKYARIISDKFDTDHKEIILDSSYMKLLDKVIYHMDEPLADFAAFPTYVLSKFARKKVKVVLTGEGGDENFGGYSYYNQFRILNKLPFISKELLYTKKIFAYNYTKYLKASEFENSYFFLKRKLIRGYFGKGDFLNQMLRWDIKVWLPDDLLMKVDKTTMAASLEARVPFLDHRFMEFVASVNPKFKLDKYILKKAFKDKLPKEIFERKKHGFDVPVNLWFNTVYKERVDQLVNDNSNVLSKYFKFNLIKRMLNKERDNLFLWRLYNFIVWHNRFVGNL
jgi:asparagine synthase (glutamine-hydrolysing)